MSHTLQADRIAKLYLLRTAAIQRIKPNLRKKQENIDQLKALPEIAQKVVINLGHSRGKRKDVYTNADTKITFAWFGDKKIPGLRAILRDLKKAGWLRAVKGPMKDAGWNWHLTDGAEKVLHKAGEYVYSYHWG